MSPEDRESPRSGGKAPPFPAGADSPGSRCGTANGADRRCRGPGVRDEEGAEDQGAQAPASRAVEEGIGSPSGLGPSPPALGVRRWAAGSGTQGPGTIRLYAGVERPRGVVFPAGGVSRLREGARDRGQKSGGRMRRALSVSLLACGGGSWLLAGGERPRPDHLRGQRGLPRERRYAVLRPCWVRRLRPGFAEVPGRSRKKLETGARPSTACGWRWSLRHVHHFDPGGGGLPASRPEAGPGGAAAGGRALATNAGAEVVASRVQAVLAAPGSDMSLTSPRGGPGPRDSARPVHGQGRVQRARWSTGTGRRRIWATTAGRRIHLPPQRRREPARGGGVLPSSTLTLPVSTRPSGWPPAAPGRGRSRDRAAVSGSPACRWSWTWTPTRRPWSRRRVEAIDGRHPPLGDAGRSDDGDRAAVEATGWVLRRPGRPRAPGTGLPGSPACP